MARATLDENDRTQLLDEIQELRKKLDRRKSELTKTKAKLAGCREKMLKMKATILYQRSRILQFYRAQDDPAATPIKPV